MNPIHKFLSSILFSAENTMPTPEQLTQLQNDAVQLGKVGNNLIVLTKQAADTDSALKEESASYEAMKTALKTLVDSL